MRVPVHITGKFFYKLQQYKPKYTEYLLLLLLLLLLADRTATQ